MFRPAQKLNTAKPKSNERVHFEKICNKYGIDTITGGATIAWAMEAFEDRYASLGLTSPLPAQTLDPAKVEFVRITQQFFGMLDSVNLCHFVWGVSS